MEDDLWELRNTKLPRHHRDAEDVMRWAADEITRLRTALQKISAGNGDFLAMSERDAKQIARNALTQSCGPTAAQLKSMGL